MKNHADHEMVKRNISIAGTATTIVLENLYWKLLQMEAKKREITWQRMCQAILRNQPASYNSGAGYLRFYCTVLLRPQFEKAVRTLAAAQTKSP